MIKCFFFTKNQNLRKNFFFFGGGWGGGRATTVQCENYFEIHA